MCRHVQKAHKHFLLLYNASIYILSYLNDTKEKRFKQTCDITRLTRRIGFRRHDTLYEYSPEENKLIIVEL